MYTQHAMMSTLTSFTVSHVSRYARLSLSFSSDRAKVIREINIAEEGVPGDEAILILSCVWPCMGPKPYWLIPTPTKAGIS